MSRNVFFQPIFAVFILAQFQNVSFGDTISGRLIDGSGNEQPGCLIALAQNPGITTVTGNDGRFSLDLSVTSASQYKTAGKSSSLKGSVLYISAFRGGNLRVEFLDLNGKQIQLLSYSNIASGKYEFNFGEFIKNQPHNSVYLLSVKMDDYSKVYKILNLKNDHTAFANELPISSHACLAKFGTQIADTLLLQCHDWPTYKKSVESQGDQGDILVNPPNILFILTDDQGWSQINTPMDPDIPEAYSDYLETPGMTRMAREGLRFASGYSPAPLCTPTRRSIVLGATAARSGGEFKSSYIPHEHITLPTVLKQAHPAYVTAHYGKWGKHMISTPEQCGYDSSDGMTENETGGMENKNEEFHLDNDPKRTGTLTQRAVDFMETQGNSGKPFYLQVSYYAAHLRVELLQQTLTKWRAKGIPDRAYTQPWAGMLQELDAGISNLLESVDRIGIAGHTYVFLMADNGGRASLPGDGAVKGSLPPNHPLKGAKHTLYEGGIRVPFMVNSPGIPTGKVNHVPVTGYDLLPTFYDLAGGKAALPEEIDGVSFRSLLDDSDETTFSRPFGALIFHRPEKKQSAIREGNYKLLINWGADWAVLTRVLTNLSSDITETVNLYSANRQKADDLETKLMDYLEAVNAEKP